MDKDDHRIRDILNDSTMKNSKDGWRAGSRDMYGSLNWKNLDFDWMNEEGKVDISSIIQASEDIDMKRRPMTIGYHSPMRGFDALPPLMLVKHFDRIKNKEWSEKHYEAKDPKWPDKGLRFSVEVSDLVRHTDDKGRKWSPKIVIEVYEHESYGPSQNRTDYHYNWAAYRHQTQWNDVIQNIHKANKQYVKAVRDASAVSDWNF
jgi:hypothetical protein